MSATKTNPKTARLSVDALEAREMPAVLSAVLEGTNLVVRCTNTPTNAEVRPLSSMIRVTEGARVWSFDAACVTKVTFHGGTAADRFANNTAVKSSAYGYEGNDVFLGGSSTDYLDGGVGNDRLNGRAGADQLLGSGGDDVLIAIDGTSGDYVDPWTGRDVVWVDDRAGVCDRLSGYGTPTVQRVKAFSNVGADLTLNGDRIADPTTKAGHTYKRFAGNPLFGAAGPRADDLDQGGLGDCWVLAGLGTVARHDQGAVRAQVVDFDDGTYGVKLGSKFYRVDDDLPVASAASTAPVYGGLGADRSMWVAVAEKAMAHHRTGENSYASIVAGRAVDVYEAFGCTNGVTVNFGSFASARALGDEMYRRWAAGEMLSIGTGSPKAAGLDVGPTINKHAYVVIKVEREWSASLGRYVVTKITLRNPHGTDGGGSTDGVNDGLVTVTPAQLYNRTGRFYSGTL